MKTIEGVKQSLNISEIARSCTQGMVIVYSLKNSLVMQSHHEILIKQTNPDFDFNLASNSPTIRTSSNDLMHKEIREHFSQNTTISEVLKSGRGRALVFVDGQHFSLDRNFRTLVSMIVGFEDRVFNRNLSGTTLNVKIDSFTAFIDKSRACLRFQLRKI